MSEHLYGPLTLPLVGGRKEPVKTLSRAPTTGLRR
jgi:hypothetical protein